MKRPPVWFPLLLGFAACLLLTNPSRGGVLSLDGVDGWVELSNADGAIPSGADPFTIEAWVNPTVHADSTITFWGNQAGNQANGFRLKGGGTTRHYFWGNDHDTTATGDLVDDAGGPNGDGWHHLAITWDGTQTQWYWNGAPLEGPRNAAGVNVADANHRIGSRLGAEFFNGFLDEIRIWEVARSADDIAANLEFEIDPATSGLVAYYQFNTADDYTDSTAGGHDGVAMGGATVDVNQNAPVAPAADSDGDMLPDAWELRWPSVNDLDALNGLGSGPGPGAGTGDLDGDGLADAEEFAQGLNPTSEDTDGDGLRDDERDVHGTDPKNADSDGDGLSDGDEINLYGTDPLDSDSDDDFFNDGVEIANNTDPNDPNSPGAPSEAGALCLDGASIVTFTNPNGLIPSGDAPFTIESWINPTSIPAGGGNGGQITFWGNQAGNQSNGFRLRGATGVRHYFWGNDHDENFTEDILADTTGPGGNGWHHLAITYDGTQTVWYWNGAPLGAPRAVSGVTVADANHRIGSRLNAEFFDGWIDELRIWDVPRSASEIADNFGLALPPDTPGLVAYWNFSDGSFADITGNGHDGTPENNAIISPLVNAPIISLAKEKLRLAVAGEGDNLVFTWDSKSGKLYNLLSETDPSSADPASWPVWDGNENIAATPDENTLTVPRPGDPVRFYVIQEFDAPPTNLFFEDFEGGQGSWTTGGDGAPGTAWVLGTPSNVGPVGAGSGSFCFGTNISSDYTDNADVWLRSPAIDLTTATEGFLSYLEARDIELTFDFGTVSVLDAADDSVIAVLKDNIDGVALDWDSTNPIALPAEALGKVIKIEFRFNSDNFNDQPRAGWYVDDVRITD